MPTERRRSARVVRASQSRSRIVVRLGRVVGEAASCQRGAARRRSRASRAIVTAWLRDPSRPVSV